MCSCRPDCRTSRNSHAPTSGRRLAPGVHIVPVERSGISISTTSTDRRSSIDPNGGLGGGCLLGSVHLNSHNVPDQRSSMESGSSSSDGIVESANGGDENKALNGQRLNRSPGGSVHDGPECDASPISHRHIGVGANSEHGRREYVTDRVGLATCGRVNRVPIGDDGSFTWS